MYNSESNNLKDKKNALKLGQGHAKMMTAVIITQTKLTEILPQAALYLEYTSVRVHNMANRFQPENQPNQQKTPGVNII